MRKNKCTKCFFKRFICSRICKDSSGENSSFKSDVSDSNTISFDDFLKLDLRVGKVKEAQKIEGSDKLLKTIVDFGELGEKVVVSGIAKHRAPEELVGKKFVYIVNLPPRKIFGVESQAMILAASGDDFFAIITPDKDAKEGSKIS